VLELGWAELAMVAVLALIVIGPRDLPGALRSLGRTIRWARRSLHDLQRHLEDAIGEDIDEVRDQVRDLDPRKAAANTLDPDGEVRSAAREMDPRRPSGRGDETDESAYGRSGRGLGDRAGTTADDDEGRGS
jgi:sec-independent protein translocase protein TatB